MASKALFVLKKYFPILDWLPGLKRSDIRQEIIAGLTVGVMLVPQGMAYALLAGMPPIYGLYGGLVPMLIYAIFGTSPKLSIGPVAVSALLVLAGISQLADPLSDRYVELVLLTGLLVGGLQVLLSIFRLGFFVNFLSQPVVFGFTSAAAVIIVVSQLKDLFGIEVPRMESLTDTVEYVYLHISEINWPTFALGGGGVLLILLLKRIDKRIPASLFAMIAGILLVRFLNLESSGVEIVGSVPEGLPDFQLPAWSLENIKLVLPTVLTVCLIGIVESISIAKYLESKHQDHTIRPNQELLGLGLSKLTGAFFQAIPTSASFTRSAVNDDAGAKSQLASIITALLIGLTLAFLTSLFFFLPKAILASVILVAVRKLFHWKEALHFWKVYRSDFFMLIVTFLITLILGSRRRCFSRYDPVDHRYGFPKFATTCCCIGADPGHYAVSEYCPVPECDPG